jgi:uncharacterized protein (DUF697 family)/tellurite resistance protein
MTQTEDLSEQELKTLPSICILAAMADGSQSALERMEIKRLANRFSEGELDLNEAYTQALAGQASLPHLARQLQSNDAKQLAYEMAVCICSVDNTLNESEKQFLSNLHRTLGLDVAHSNQFHEQAATFSAPVAAQPPVLSSIGAAPALVPSVQSAGQALNSEVEQMILNRAIVAGALEIMPQNLATMAIIPVQIQLVYAIGKRYGHELSLSSAKEFLATIGVGMTSQVVESYLTNLVRGASKRFAGKFVGSMLSQVTQSAVAFATTYAIGHAANKYYSSGRTISMDQVKDVFGQMLNQGRTMSSQYSSQIVQQASKLKTGDLLSLVKN